MNEAREKVKAISNKAKEECIAIAKKAFAEAREVMKENHEQFDAKDYLELDQVELLWRRVELL